MKIRWREADRRSDSEGRPADETLGATSVRRRWSGVLRKVVARGEVVRIRHQYFDEPALLVPESLFRELERQARRGRDEEAAEGAGGEQGGGV